MDESKTTMTTEEEFAAIEAETGAVRQVLSTVRTIEAVTGEILEAKRVGGEAILTIGKGLIEAKAMLDHGEWLPWLTEKVEFSERSAQNFMRLAKEYSNPQTVADLGASKALVLLALPENERADFVAEPHEVDGEEKTVAEMSKRELEQVIRERDEARKRVDDAHKEITRLNDEVFNVTKSADKLEGKLKKAEAELKELKSRPVDVAVEKVVDDTAVKAAEAERDKALEAVRLAETNAEVARKAREKVEGRIAELQKELETAKAEKPDPFAGDDTLLQFKLLFEQAQEIVNKMHGLLLKVKNTDAESAEKLGRALDALAGKVKEAAA